MARLGLHSISMWQVLTRTGLELLPLFCFIFLKNISSIFSYSFLSPLSLQNISTGVAPSWVCRNLAVGSHQTLRYVPVLLHFCLSPHPARPASAGRDPSCRLTWYSVNSQSAQKGIVSLSKSACARAFLRSQDRWHRQIKHFQGNQRGTVLLSR